MLDYIGHLPLPAFMFTSLYLHIAVYSVYIIGFLSMIILPFASFGWIYTRPIVFFRGESDKIPWLLLSIMISAIVGLTGCLIVSVLTLLFFWCFPYIVGIAAIILGIYFLSKFLKKPA